MTKRMAYACEIVGINLLDHVIVGSNGFSYFSFHEKGLLEQKQEPSIAAEERTKVR